jgi:hypothetical protein
MNDFKLDSEPRIKSGFRAPDAYFESFADRVMLSLPLKEVKVVPLYRRRPVWVTSVAAVFILSLSLVFTRKDATVQMPDNAAIENYLLYQANISSYDLSENLSKKEISDMDKSSVADDISDEAIEEYLAGENVSIYE